MLMGLRPKPLGKLKKVTISNFNSLKIVIGVEVLPTQKTMSFYSGCNSLTEGPIEKLTVSCATN
jgi:hypothetical protein